MKKLTHLGCLLALVFAGASTFADSWFDVTSFPQTTDARWTVPEGDATKWSIDAGVAHLKDWNDGAVYTAAEEKSLDDADTKITTTVKFTAMDPEDLATHDISDAKAGVTLVELGAELYQFKVIQFDSVGFTNHWVDVVPTLTAVPAAIPVTVEIFKSDDVANVKYTIGDISVDASSIGVELKDATIRSVEYKGECWISPALIGLAWSNKEGVPSTVVVDNPPQGCPTTIKYNHGDLKARLGDKADDDAQVIAYMTGKQNNGQFGWVNYALGQADNLSVGIQSNDAAVVEGKLSFDFGFVVDTDNYEVSYTVDTEAAAATAEVGIESGVHTVAVTVKDKNGGQTYNVTNQVVGVMQAESPASTGKKDGTKVYEIVAVPWEAFGHTAVTVENLLVTSLLRDGDTLYVWNNGGYYDTYVLTAGAWVAQSHTSFSSQTGAVTKEGTSAADNALAQGTAVWIEHDVASKIVFTGMLKDDSKTSTVTTTVFGSKSEDVWTLVANPSIKPFALAGIEGAAEGDRIVVEDVADPREYEYKDLAWGYDKKVIVDGKTITVRGTTIPVYTIEWTSADPIPAGIGFWYVRKANPNCKSDDENNISITFGDNDVAE